MRSKNIFRPLAVILMLFTISCAKTDGLAPGEDDLASIINQYPPSIPTDGTSSFALVYGSSASDRTFLANRIAGYQAPGLSDVFTQWRRFVGPNLYNSTSDIVQTPAYCFTGFNSSYNWNPGSNGGTPIPNPGSYSACMNSNDFVASSWSFISSPDRLYNAANGTNFGGFISGLKFKNFTFESILSSTDTDDDSIGLVIAATVDDSNRVHTLTAMRTQGGNQPSLGWGIVYKIDNSFVRIFGEKSVGGVNTNSSQGDRLGWNSRRTLVRVERADNLVTASASLWGTGTDPLTVDSASTISIDLNDATLGLTIFQNEQYYGYGTMSQLGATFSSIVFTTPNSEVDPSYIYDLENNAVYAKQSSGGYVIVPGVLANNIIGFPKRVKNTETQKEFTIDSATGYTAL